MKRILFTFGLIAAVCGSAIAQETTTQPLTPARASLAPAESPDPALNAGIRLKSSEEQTAQAMVRPDAPGIGDQLIDLELFDTGYGMYSLAGMAEKGKYLLVNFWTPVCRRCHLGFKAMQKYYDQYKDKLTLVGVLLTDDTESWINNYKDKPLFPWHDLSDNKRIKEGAGVTYGIGLFPVYLLVDGDGKIVERWGGYAEETFDSHIKPYLEGKTGK